MKAYFLQGNHITEEFFEREDEKDNDASCLIRSLELSISTLWLWTEIYSHDLSVLRNHNNTVTVTYVKIVHCTIILTTS